ASPVRCWVDNASSLNTERDEIAPSISTDGSEMILSSNRPNSHEPNALGIYDYEIYSSSLLDNGWSTPNKLTGPINSNNDDISNCLSYDGTKMLLHRENGGQTDIFESKLKGNEWSDPKMLSIFISSDKNNERYASYNE